MFGMPVERCTLELRPGARRRNSCAPRRRSYTPCGEGQRTFAHRAMVDFATAGGNNVAVLNRAARLLLPFGWRATGVATCVQCAGPPARPEDFAKNAVANARMMQIPAVRAGAQGHGCGEVIDLAVDVQVRAARIQQRHASAGPVTWYGLAASRSQLKRDSAARSAGNDRAAC